MSQSPYDNDHQKPMGRHARPSAPPAQPVTEDSQRKSKQLDSPVQTIPANRSQSSVNPPTHPGPEPPRKRRRPLIIGLVVALVVCVGIAGVSIGYVIWQNATMGKSPAPDEELLIKANEKSANPIDFEALQEENPDIYAWIYIPGTGINLPILQHPSDDGFYLAHNRYGESAIEGSLYTEMANAKDFSDPVTVIYGHNTTNGTMFANLHYFENPEFFDQNRNFYIYTPGHILTYEVISAYQYDNRHILNSFNFQDESVVQTYFDSVADPDALIKNVSGRAAPVAGIDRIVQLSTCTGDENRVIRRYLVTGVLVDDVEAE